MTEIDVQSYPASTFPRVLPVEGISAAESRNTSWLHDKLSGEHVALSPGALLYLGVSAIACSAYVSGVIIKSTMRELAAKMRGVSNL